MDDNKQKKDNKSSKKVLVIIGILMILVGLVLFIYGVFCYQSAKVGQEEYSSLAETTQTESENSQDTVENPIDFASLQAKNDEIYAWLNVPDTNVDYPVVQSAESDDFYLKHSATDKSWLASGAIYTQSLNNKDFNDKITVIYGHNGYSDTMFTTLHYFEDSEFFNSHPYFYIYTEDSKLTYQVISAFKYDDRHILNSFDFNDVNVLSSFLSMLQNPTSSNKNVRTDLDKEITNDDNIVILSTCIKNQKSSRYLVCGVKVKDEKTN